MSPALIAECCQNHNGDPDLLARMVDEAAAAGADLVKIQAIRSEDLVRRERFEEDAIDEAGNRTAILRPFLPEQTRLRGLDLSRADEEAFAERCRAAGVTPMITLFTRGVAATYRDLGFEVAKIASYDCGSVPLLRETAAAFPRTVVSTGASFDEEVDRAVEVFAPGTLTLLHAVTIYPTGLDDLHLARMDWLRERCPSVGFSDHTAPGATGLRATMLALALGAVMIERHFTVLGPTETRDGPVSVDPTDLARLRAFADLSESDRWTALEEDWAEWRTGLGQAQRAMTPTELGNRDYYRGRFATHRDGIPWFNWEES